MTNQNQPEEADLNYHPGLWQTAFLTRWHTSELNPEAIENARRESVAKTLLFEGMTLIPSEHLLDNQMVVSRKVYEAAVLQIEYQNQVRREVKDAEKTKA